MTPPSRPRVYIEAVQTGPRIIVGVATSIAAFLDRFERGNTPREAYFVKCDRETVTQDDIGFGRVNILVGFAALKPAEFVILRVQQRAGQGG